MATESTTEEENCVDNTEVPTAGSIRHIKVTTVEELEPSWVRWFYKSDNEKKWTVFCGNDSLNLEHHFRAFGNNKSSIMVRGNMYSVDLSERSCIPVFWTNKGPACKVTRGIWFYESNWEPIDEILADRIENEQLRCYRHEKLQEDPNVKLHLKTIHKLKLEEMSLRVEWKSNSIVYIYNDSRSSKFYRVVSSHIGLHSGERLHRSYCKEAVMADKLPVVSHLVFVIHGIGQKNDPNSIIDSCDKFREVCLKIKGSHFRDLELDNHRVEFLPVDWRLSHNFNDDVVTSVMLHKMRRIRTLFNNTALDIMYYTSPLYRNDIVNGLEEELKRLYSLFISHNPDFEKCNGKVSLFCHSLGSVIMFDILAKWDPSQLYDKNAEKFVKDAEKFSQASNLVDELKQAREKVDYLEKRIFADNCQSIQARSLPFRVEFFFCVGSPLAMFLAVRGIQSLNTGSADHFLPKSACRRIFNVFHSFDPVAYRLEPLVCEQYAQIMPLLIYRHDAKYNRNYDVLPSTMYPARKPNCEVVCKSEVSAKECTVASNDKMKVHYSNEVTSTEVIAIDMADSDNEMDYEVIKDDLSNFPTEPVHIENRIDFQLKERKMEFSIISALTSHTSYWSNPDVALFVMTQLFPDYLLINN